MKRQLAYALFLGMGLVLLLSCTPETKYRVLSTFFDGVPLPESMVMQPDTAGRADTLRARPRRRFPQPQIQYSFHPPYREKECDACHERSGGNRLVDPLPDLCYGCHDDFSESYAFLHGPIASGNCTACHNPHMTKNEHLLKRAGNALCLYCHDEKRLATTSTHADKMQLRCQECHDPHGSNKQFFLSRR